MVRFPAAIAIVLVWVSRLSPVAGQPPPAPPPGPPAADPGLAPPASIPVDDDTGPDPGPDLGVDDDTASRPWHQGVSVHAKARARELYDAGNELNDRWHESYDNELLVDAIRLYREALDHWQHPSIQLNLAHTLILLHREAAAYENLVMAVRYGPEPLETEDDYRWAIDQLARLEAILAVIDVRSYQDGVQVSLDGAVLFDGPRAVKKYVLPGTHTLVANKDGFLTETVKLNLQPQEKKVVLFSLVAWQETSVSRRPSSVWKPWVTVGAGAALVTVGALLRWRAGVDYRRFDSEFTSWCRTPGCSDMTIPARLDDIRTRARRENQIGMSALALGGTVAVLGTAWLILNQPVNVPVRDSGVMVAPFGTSDQGGILASWIF